jgi:succinate dehydrogenase / fumarate reductase cytochrome b subunit
MELQATSEPRVAARNFLLSRLGSLLAFFPLGVWTAVHLWNQLSAFDGAQAWQRSVTGHSSDASTALTMTLVLGPLVWHVGWGTARLFRTRSSREKTFSNLRYWLQRASAVGLFAFLCAHLWLAWAHPRFVEGRAERFADIASEMHHHTPTLVVYVLGVLAVAYHLANGIWSFATMGWGVAVGRNSQAWLERISVLVFLGLLAVGFGAIYALYQAGA